MSRFKMEKVRWRLNLADACAPIAWLSFQVSAEFPYALIYLQQPEHIWIVAVMKCVGEQVAQTSDSVPGGHTRRESTVRFRDKTAHPNRDQSPRNSERLQQTPRQRRDGAGPSLPDASANAHHGFFGRDALHFPFFDFFDTAVNLGSPRSFQFRIDTAVPGE